MPHPSTGSFFLYSSVSITIMVHVIFVVACDTLGPNRRGCHKSKSYGAEKLGGGGSGTVG